MEIGICSWVMEKGEQLCVNDGKGKVKNKVSNFFRYVVSKFFFMNMFYSVYVCLMECIFCLFQYFVEILISKRNLLILLIVNLDFDVM